MYTFTYMIVCYYFYYYHEYKINAKHALSVQLQAVGEQAGDRVKYLLTDDFTP